MYESHADWHGEQIHGAIEAASRDTRGLRPAKAEERLVAELRARGVFLSQGTVRELALHMSDPWWPARHPVKAMRQLRADNRADDLESRRYKAEADALHERIDWSDLHEKLDSFSIRSTRTFEGMAHEITIDPWSPEMAKHVHDLTAPLEVTVKPPA